MTEKNQSSDLKPGFLAVLSRMRRKGRAGSRSWQWLLSHFYRHHKVLGAQAFFESLVFGVTGKPPTKALSSYTDELAQCAALQRVHHQAYPGTPDHRLRNPALVAFYYAFIREFRPSCIVETGTAAGSLSSLILAALSANKEGRLISLDIPAEAGKLTMDSTVSPEKVGFLIPDEFRDRWHYLAGDAKLTLPKVLAEEDVDIFIHDSLHTRTHMSFEFAVARALMRPNTVIASDDSLWNSAWLDFTHTHKLMSLSCIRNPQLCVSINTFDDFEVAQGLGVCR